MVAVPTPPYAIKIWGAVIANLRGELAVIPCIGHIAILCVIRLDATLLVGGVAVTVKLTSPGGSAVCGDSDG